MAKLQRKSAKLFAEDATASAGGLAQFGSLAAGTPNYSTDPDVIQALDAYKEGWSSAVLGTKSPALEDRNALDYLLSYQQAYIMQRGIPEYLDTETYYIGSVVSNSSQIYISLTDNNTGNALTDTANWRKFYTPVEIDTLLAEKADTDLSNLSSTGEGKFDAKANTSLDNITTAGKNTAVSFAKPDLSAAVSVPSGTVLTDNGWLLVDGQNISNFAATCSIDGLIVFESSFSGTGTTAHIAMFQVYAGQTITYSYLSGCTFYPLDIN